MALIYKIVEKTVWDAAVWDGFFTGAPVDLKDGYIHFSAADQVQETAFRHFRGRNGLLLVAFEAEALGPALRWEASRGGALFPHLHAPLATALAAWIKPLPMLPDGTHAFPPLDGTS